MIAVSDSSPLILFSRTDQLGILEALYTEIVVPPAVWDEVVIPGAGRSGTAAIQSFPVRIADRRTAGDLLAELGPGATEAIGLSSELRPTGPLLLDDLNGRRVAGERGVSVTGSAGVLVAAKERGVIPAVRPLLHDLRDAGLSLSDGALRRLLAIAGE